MKRTLSIAAFISLGVAALLPLSASADSLRVFIDTQPPAARHERVPAARNGYVWAPGYWNWEHGRHVWRAGHWERARKGYQYQRHEWQRGRDGYYLVRGGWQPARKAHNRRDRDRDGIPNAYDRDRDNDGVSNRYDRDRDGDGVRNDRDRRPDNPNR